MLELKNVSKYYYKKGIITTGFSKINLKFEMGEFVAITGESGSGKSTLLNVLSGLDTYEEGEMYINGEETSYYTEKDYEIYRKKYVGNIFQNFNLVNSYTVYQNIELIYILNGYKKKDVKDKINELIKEVDLVKYKNKKVSKLSGGQKQRVAIARALASNAPVILADEPTGNLDKNSAKKVLEVLHNISKDKLVIVVTHNYEQIEEYVTRKIIMSDGRVIEDKKLKEYDKVKNINLLKSKEMSLFSKLRVGIRNAFNILPKTLIIGFVYLFAIFSMFVVYSSFELDKNMYEDDGYTYYFKSDYPNRMVLQKKDKSKINEEDFNKLKELKDITYIEKYDLFYERTLSLSNEGVYFYGTVKNINTLDKVDIGRLPEKEDEFVLETNKMWSEVKDLESFEKYAKNLYKSESRLNNKYKLVGVKFYDKYDSTFYFKEEAFNKLYLDINSSEYNIKYTINKTTFESNYYSNYNELLPSDKVKKGTIIIPEEFNYLCKNFNCKNTKINIKTEELFSKNNYKLKVVNTYKKDNIKKLTGYSYKDSNSNLFMNTEDYINLFTNDIYQCSVLINEKNDKELKNTLEELGYKVLYIKDTISNYDDIEIIKILNIVKLLVNIGLVVGLFFISYFIIKLVLRSRNIYYSTLRILGCTYKDTKKLLNVELFVLSNLAYIIFIGLLLFAKYNIGNLTGLYEILNECIEVFKIKQFILMYIIIAFMTFLTTERYSRKLFVNSVMNTYREEV